MSMYSLKKNYISFFFDLINQNYLFSFSIKSLKLISYISFSLPVNAFDSFDKKFFNYFLFLEWLVNLRPFLLNNKLICHLRKFKIYEFLVFFNFFILDYNNLSVLNYNLSSNIVSFNLESFRKIPFLPSIFYNLQVKINCILKFEKLFYKLSYIQRKNFLIFLFNIL